MHAHACMHMHAHACIRTYVCVYIYIYNMFIIIIIINMNVIPTSKGWESAGRGRGSESAVKFWARTARLHTKSRGKHYY